jgi:hypothetical protein
VKGHANRLGFIISELEKRGKSEHVQEALQELPDRANYEKHALGL